MSDNDDVVDAIGEVREAVEDVKKAIKDRNITGTVAGIFMVLLVFSWLDSLWYSSFRYSIQYQVSTGKVSINPKPHDCNFLAAPIGEKYCEYNRSVHVVYWSTSTTGQPIMSDDDGKTWTTFTPEVGVSVPQYKTAVSVDVTWDKTIN